MLDSMPGLGGAGGAPPTSKFCRHSGLLKQFDVLEGAGDAKAGDLIGGAGQQIIDRQSGCCPSAGS